MIEGGVNAIASNELKPALISLLRVASPTPGRFFTASTQLFISLSLLEKFSTSELISSSNSLKASIISASSS